MEDWSTVWEIYFQNPTQVITTASNGNTVLTQKLQAVDAFFAAISSAG
jgi:hypothetical protein